MHSDMPETEVNRLQETLTNHLIKMNITMTKYERIEFVKTLLVKQEYTCVFGKNVGRLYCCNEQEDNYSDKENKYLKLQWGCIKARYIKKEKSIDDLYLLCSRCNNQIHKVLWY